MSNQAIDDFMSWLDCKIESLTEDDGLDDYMVKAPTYERHQHEGLIRGLLLVEQKAKEVGFITPEYRGHGLEYKGNERMDAEYTIEMCRKAKEIQDLWEPDLGDRIYIEDSIGITNRNGFEFLEVIDLGRDKEILKKIYLWIPRQEDLQEIALKKQTDIGNIESLLEDFFLFIDSPDTVYNAYTTTITRLWLEFLMYNFYGKEWDAERKEWMKI